MRSVTMLNQILALIGGTSLFFFWQSANHDSPIVHETVSFDTAYGLPDNLSLGNITLPESYDLQLKVFLPGYVDFSPENNFLFIGKVKIRIHMLKPTSKIVLNSFGLEITSSRLFSIKRNKTSSEVNIAQYNEIPSLERIEFNLGRQLESGEKVELHLHFKGTLNDDNAGFYKTKYSSADGTEKIAAMTNFAPIHARSMVPCYDEMAMKATWKIEVSHPRGTHALSNQEVLKKTTDLEDGSFLISSFKTTPKMSSYLLVVVVSEFVSANKTSNQIKYGVWSRPESLSMTNFALNSAVKCTEFYEKYFGIQYPLGKLDMAAVPDLTFGAMENWGLITYKETNLLYNPKLHSANDRIHIARIIAHELAHQWFGNLVTAKWWNDIWLNEGFATLVQNLGADAISDGKFKMMDSFLTYSCKNALEIDDKSSSHPLSRNITKTSDILGVYDTLSYQKGASVMAMIRYLIGFETFQTGLQNYLKNHLYGNAEANDLLKSFDEVLPNNITGPDGRRLNITKFAEQWIFQMGYPYVTLSRINSTTIHISQNVYLIGGNESELEPSPYGYKWDIPLWIQKGDNPKQLYWLTRDSDLEFKDSSPEVTVLNAKGYAFIRQNYEENEWRLIANQLQDDHTIYSNRTCLTILSDAFAMAKIGQLDYDLLFTLTKYMTKEREYLSWDAFNNGFSRIQSALQQSSIENDAKKFYATILRPHYSKDLANTISETYLDDNLIYENLRDTLIFETYCTQTGNCTELRDSFSTKVAIPCANETEAIASTCSTVAAPLRAIVYCNEVKEDVDAFSQILSFYKKETVVVEKNRLLYALGCSKNQTLLTWLLDSAVNRTNPLIRLQDIGAVFYNVATSDFGSQLVFDYLLNNWDNIYKDLASQHITLNDIIDCCLLNVKTDAEIIQLENFAKTADHINDFEALPKQLQNARQMVSWLADNEEKLGKIFKQTV